MDNRVELEALDPSRLSLPEEYLVLDERAGERQPVVAMWSLGASAQPTNNTCGEELMWAWSDRAPSSTTLGDPAIHLFICDAGNAESAATHIAAVPIEESVVPQLDNIYHAMPIPTDGLGLGVDTAQVACVWGDPSTCRAWAYAAAYGRYVVNVHFVMAGQGGGLLAEDFEDLIVSVDQWMVEALLE